MGEQPCVGVLYLDMNSYFASVEQQAEPRLRGRPVAVIPADSENTCCIAASVEAKMRGVKTGTIVREARRLCPEIVLCPARHDLYVEYHHRIKAAVEWVAPVATTHSIDEVSCNLIGRDRKLERALSLARQVKQSVRRHAGEALRCSVGLGSNRLLAKIAGELTKPDGLDWLTPEVLPDKLCHLALDDLPGISRRMTARLNQAGVWNIPQLWDLAPRQARLIWSGVQGERFLRMLWGEEIPDPETRRRSVGHSQVLAPECRNREAARLVVRRLLTKAAARLRRMGFFASRLSLAAKCLQTGRWRAETRMQATQDSFIMLSALEMLWRRSEMRAPLWVGVTLSGLIATDMHTSDLFERRAAPGELTVREQLCVRIDALNQRYGRDAIAFGDTPARLAAYSGAKIAFTRVPGLNEFMD